MGGPFHPDTPSPLQIMSNYTFDDLYENYDNIPALQQALNEGADVNMLDDEDGGTLLMVAAAFANVEALQFLLDSKACLDIKAEDGQTALDVAQKYGTPECVELLIAAALERDLIRVAQ